MPANRPNVLLILIDDLGWRDIGCFGSEFYETPNIDALAAESMLFTDAYAACPVCSPTRASILTGKYPARLGLTNYIDWGWELHPRRGRVIDAPYIRQMPHTERSLARALKAEGYDTCHVGKWHLGGPDYYPDKHGFDQNFGGCEWGLPMGGYFAPWGIPTLQEAREGTYLPDHLTDCALSWLANRENRPWFLNLWYYCVHTPIQAPAELVEKYQAKAERLGLDQKTCVEQIDTNCFEMNDPVPVYQRTVQSYADYAAMIEQLDANIGRVVAYLKQTGQWEDTMIVFTSDNGGLATGRGPSVTSNLPLHAGKGWMYEGGTRVSTFIRRPGVTRPGSRCDVPITSTDYYPTLLAAAGGDPAPAQHCDGVDLAPLLSGEGSLKRDAIFWHYPHYSNCHGRPGCSVRMGDWKLIEFFEDGHLELYNLREDIAEDHDLADAEPDRRDRMHARLEAWKEQMAAREPTPNPDWQPARADKDDPTSPLV